MHNHEVEFFTYIGGPELNVYESPKKLGLPSGMTILMRSPRLKSRVSVVGDYFSEGPFNEISVVDRTKATPKTGSNSSLLHHFQASELNPVSHLVSGAAKTVNVVGALKKFIFDSTKV